MSDQELGDLLKEFAKGPIQCLPGVVTSVADAESKYIVDVKPIGGAPLLEVRLKATINENINDGIVEIPAKDSAVLVGIINGDADTAFMVKTSKVSKILINGQVIINQGNFKGLAKIDESVAKYNAIENSLNDLKSKISTWVPAPMDGGLGLKTILVDWIADVFILTQVADLEDDKVTH